MSMRQRLSVDIPKEVHRQLWKLAKRKNITLTRYVTRALLRYMFEDQKYERKEDDAEQETVVR